MRWKKYGVEMDMTGITRKAVAEILAEQFDTKVVFCLSDNGYNVPDQNQRLWRILPSDSIKAEKYNGDVRWESEKASFTLNINLWETGEK